MKFLAAIIATLFLAHNAMAAEQTTSYGVSLFGDLKYPKDFKNFDYVNPNAPKGGKLTEASIGSYDTLNGFVVKGRAADATGLLFDTLLASAEDEPSSAYGLLAESVTRPADNTWVEFNLRKDAKFSDGSPVTPEDVIFTFNTLMEKGHPHYKAYYRDVSKVEKTGPHSVKFYISNPANRELAGILGQFPILSKKFYETHDFTKADMTVPLGSGPYLLDAAEPGKFIRYKRNPNYWGKDLPVNRGKYNFDLIQIDYYRDETVAVQALLAGQYDFRLENIARIWANGYDSPAIKSGELIKTEIPHEIPTGMQGFFFNIRRDKFSDLRVRKAITLAFDFEWANKNLFNSAYTRTDSYFSNSELAAHGLPPKEELALLEPFRDSIPAEVFAAAATMPVNKDQNDVRQHLLEAKQLLNEAGWSVKDGALKNDKGQTLAIEFLINSQSFERVLAPFVKNLKTLGIQANIRLVDSAQYQERMDHYDFDMTVLTIGESLSPGNEQVAYWHSSKADAVGGQNYIGIKNKAIDAMIEKIVSAKSRPELITACRALDRILLSEYYVVPNWHIRAHRLAYWNKFGRPQTNPKYGLPIAETWWSKDAEKQK